MSERNIGLHHRAVEAFNVRDIETLVTRLSDPSTELRNAFAAVGGVYHGHDGMRRWHRDLEDAWGDEIRIEPKAYFDLGEHTLLCYVFRGRGRHSGAEVAMPRAQVLRWRDGLCVYVRVYEHIEDALKDLGVSEDALQSALVDVGLTE